MATLYCLRAELEYSPRTEGEEPGVVIHDPRFNRYFKFSGPHLVLLDLLRSPIDLDRLTAAMSDQLGAPVSPASVARLLDSLEKRNLLEAPPGRKPEGEDPGKQGLLYLRLASLNAERVFRWLLPRTQWVFTPAFHGLAILAIVAGLLMTALHGARIATDAWALLTLDGLLLAWFVVMAVVTLHELAHGLTCTYFGGKVRELGFMLIYFQPAFYCDVSDSWMFPSRRQKLWVSFAGGYFQLAVWGVAALVWRVSAEDALIHRAALIVILFSGLQTLLNFNPLIKLDGYYMLSDYLGIPNLRARANRAVQAWLSGKPDPLLDSSQRRALLIYGTLSVTFSAILLTFVYVNIYLLATAYFAFAGLAAFALFLVFTLKRTASESIGGAKALISRAFIRKHRNLGIAAGLLLFICIVPWELRIAADFEILPSQQRSVRAQTAGAVEQILVREGSHVREGDVLARLFDFNKEQLAGELVGQIAAKRVELERLRAGARSEEIDRAERVVDTKRTELANVRRNLEQRNQLEQVLERERTEVRQAEIELQRAAQLAAEGLGPAIDVDRTELSLEARLRGLAVTQSSIDILAESNDAEEDLKQRELDEAVSALNLLRAGARTEDIRQRETELQSLEEQLAMLQEELLKNEIRAPISGTVVTPYVERLLNRRMNAGDEIIQIADVGRVTAELRVPEKEMAEVQLGSRVVLKARSYPSLDFTGQVDFIAPAAETLEAERFIKVRTDLANPEGLLKSEMTGVAKINAGRRPIIQLMTRRLVRWIRTEFWDLLP